MIVPAAWSLQMGLYSYLGALPDLAPLLGTPARIYDDVPHDAVFPFLTLGEGRIHPFAGVPGAREHDIRLRAFSRWGGRYELKQLTDLLDAHLHQGSFALEGHRLVHSRLVFTDIIRPRDDEIFHSLTRFRMVTEPDPA